VTNAPPTSGAFLIDPTDASAFTLFSLQASGWVDEDLPLKYAFYQYSFSAEEYIVLTQASLSTATNAYLSPGNETNDFGVELRVGIYDSYGALSYKVESARVTVDEARRRLEEADL
jgi:hypothetical protein